MGQSADRGRSALPFEVGMVEACLRSFPFKKELGRPRTVVPTGAVVSGGDDGLLAFEVTSLRNEVGPIGR